MSKDIRSIVPFAVGILFFATWPQDANIIGPQLIFFFSDSTSNPIPVRKKHSLNGTTTSRDPIHSSRVFLGLIAREVCISIFASDVEGAFRSLGCLELTAHSERKASRAMGLESIESGVVTLLCKSPK